MSKRKDGRGHWPAGRTRSDMTATQISQWRKLRLRLRRVLTPPQPGIDPLRASQRGLAAWIGVDAKTIGRWLRGERLPMSQYYKGIVQWLAKRQ